MMVSNECPAGSRNLCADAVHAQGRCLWSGDSDVGDRDSGALYALLSRKQACLHARHCTATGLLTFVAMVEQERPERGRIRAIQYGPHCLLASALPLLMLDPHDLSATIPGS